MLYERARERGDPAAGDDVLAAGGGADPGPLPGEGDGLGGLDDEGDEELIDAGAGMEVDGGGGDAAFDAAVAQVAFSVEFMVQMLSCTSAAAAPWLLRVLPSLLRLQDLVPSELQFVSLMARKALVLFKYQPLEAAPRALAALEAAQREELWPERAAALSVMQYFWFRHAPLLGRVSPGRPGRAGLRPRAASPNSRPAGALHRCLPLLLPAA